MVTGRLLCVPPALTVTTPVYVPAASPAGLAVTVTVTGAAAVACPEGGDTVSHLPPLGAATVAVATKFTVPPPVFDTVRFWLCAGVARANENEKLFLSSASDAGAAAVTVNVTLTVLVAGFALGVAIVMVP
jgi:hypothetical protein